MRGSQLVLVLAAALAVMAVAAVNPPARAEAGCASGFTLTSAGVAEADANGDGLTCEVTAQGSEGATLIAIDNASVQPSAAPEPCPDLFVLSSAAFFEKADRNENDLVCRKVFKAGQPSDPHIVQVVIDDHL